MEHKLIVGIADMKMARDSGMLVTYALGSCIGICLYDPLKKLGAMVHVMLPLNMETGRTNTMKYADTGIRETLRMMESKGAMRSRITAKIAGGAKMFEVSGGALGNIGQRNIESVHMNLKAELWRVRCCLMYQRAWDASDAMANQSLLFENHRQRGVAQYAGRR